MARFVIDSGATLQLAGAAVEVSPAKDCTRRRSGARRCSPPCTRPSVAASSATMRLGRGWRTSMRSRSVCSATPSSAGGPGRSRTGSTCHDLPGEYVALAQLEKCTLVSTDAGFLKRVGDLVPTAPVNALTWARTGLGEAARCGSHASPSSLSPRFGRTETASSSSSLDRGTDYLRSREQPATGPLVKADRRSGYLSSAASRSGLQSSSPDCRMRSASVVPSDGSGASPATPRRPAVERNRSPTSGEAPSIVQCLISSVVFNPVTSPVPQPTVSLRRVTGYPSNERSYGPARGLRAVRRAVGARRGVAR